MRSPFPGMDPFIESQLWSDFHARVIPHISERLLDQLDTNYICTVEKTVYIVTDTEDIRRLIVPDLGIISSKPVPTRQTASVPHRGVATLEPAVLTLPNTVHLEELHIAISSPLGDVVTVIEVLSPWYKSTSTGKLEYVKKRDEYALADVNIVEIDLLRGGRRLAFRESLPEGDYYTIVSRREQRPKVEVYAWNLGNPLPIVPVPLQKHQQDIALNLDEAFQHVYERARYSSTLKYDKDVSPKLSDDDQTWVSQRLQAWKETSA